MSRQIFILGLMLVNLVSSNSVFAETLDISQMSLKDVLLAAKTHRQDVEANPGKYAEAARIREMIRDLKLLFSRNEIDETTRAKAISLYEQRLAELNVRPTLQGSQLTLAHLGEAVDLLNEACPKVDNPLVLIGDSVRFKSEDLARSLEGTISLGSSQTWARATILYSNLYNEVSFYIPHGDNLDKRSFLRFGDSGALLEGQVSVPYIVEVKPEYFPTVLEGIPGVKDTFTKRDVKYASWACIPKWMRR